MQKSFPSGIDARLPRAEKLAVANIMPSLARALVAEVEEHGVSAERLCLGLGFSPADLGDAQLRLSYLQNRALIERAEEMLGELALGLATGLRQTAFSWGLPGLAMLTCETLGEAIAYGVEHQDDMGAMVDVSFEQHANEFSFRASPRLEDAAVQPFLVEEAFAGIVAVLRHLVGSPLSPVRVDFAFPDRGSKAACARFFRAPVCFGAAGNRLTFESRWLAQPMLGYDPVASRMLREQISALLTVREGRQDLVESLIRSIRTGFDEPPRQQALARQANVSERTLRRRLGAQDTSYRHVRDDALYEKARTLMADPALSIEEIAQAVGFSGVRSFRRAFKRWSGQSPSEYRKAMKPTANAPV
jgi:AraC-like DNA-binding protein